MVYNVNKLKKKMFKNINIIIFEKFDYWLNMNLMLVKIK